MKNVIAVILGFISSGVFADGGPTYICKLNNAERVITVAYAAPGKKVPCEVHYKTNDETKTLWSYQNTEGQCEKAAEEFAAKQGTWGWNCKTDAATTAQ